LFSFLPALKKTALTCLNEKVAGKKKHGIKNPVELKRNLEAEIPPELRGLLDVFVLDLSRK